MNGYKKNAVLESAGDLARIILKLPVEYTILKIKENKVLKPLPAQVGYIRGFVDQRYLVFERVGDHGGDEYHLVGATDTRVNNPKQILPGCPPSGSDGKIPGFSRNFKYDTRSGLYIPATEEDFRQNQEPVIDSFHDILGSTALLTNGDYVKRDALRGFFKSCIPAEQIEFYKRHGSMERIGKTNFYMLDTRNVGNMIKNGIYWNWRSGLYGLLDNKLFNYFTDLMDKLGLRPDDLIAEFWKFFSNVDYAVTGVKFSDKAKIEPSVVFRMMAKRMEEIADAKRIIQITSDPQNSWREIKDSEKKLAEMGKDIYGHDCEMLAA